MRRLAGIICVLGVALDAGADTLSDMKTAVSRLAAREAVRATFSTDQLVKSAGRFANNTATRKATAEVRHDKGGVTITIPQTLVERAAQESQTREGTEDTARNLIGTIRSIAVVEALDFRQPLLAMLENAEITGEKETTFRGQPSRLLTLKLNASPAKETGSIRIGGLKREDHMTLWVGRDNLPLAAERVEKSTGGFLMIKGTHTSRSSFIFGYAPDRLVLTRLETRDTGSGMGQKMERHAVQTLTVR